MDPEIIYCDNHLLLLNKPAGLLTQPNQTSSDSLEAFGKRYLKERFKKPGNVFLEAVHRLDRPVSGIVLFARTSKALSRLHEAQRQGLFCKGYLALAEGELASGEWIDYLRHDSNRAVVDPNGKRCRLTYQAVTKIGACTLVKIFLETGRYHQIRAQFAHRGHPIVGDRKYGTNLEGEALFLHHHSLSFPHPTTGERLMFSLEPPRYWTSDLTSNVLA
ncbi:MAG: RluA family pseudouridine synthase [Chlamydiales bacterium]|nr:RluA family pseudouridine synthase [Chlamydiales bacterium]